MLFNTIFTHLSSVEIQKVDLISDWRATKSKADVQKLIGFVHYYQTFTKKCSTISKPLIKIYRKFKFEWNIEQIWSFESHKKAIKKISVLRHFDRKPPIIVSTGASLYVFKDVMGLVENNVKKPVAFISKVLNEVEQRYAVQKM